MAVGVVGAGAETFLEDVVEAIPMVVVVMVGSVTTARSLVTLRQIATRR